MITDQTTPPREPVEDLSALLTMTRYISSEVSELAPRAEHLKGLLAEVAAELEAEVEKASRGEAIGKGHKELPG